MAAKYGYIGNNPADSSVFVARQAFSPSGITTTFTFASGYTIGYLDAYLNGSRLIEGQDYVATNGSTIDLVSAATGGDTLELLAYKAFNTVALTDAPGDFEIGTNLTVGGYISAGGSITGSVFYGDGSNLTGVSASKWITTSVGIHTLSNVGIGTTNPRFKLEVGAVGASGTTLFVNGDARVTGIVTIGPASITLNGITNIINVGTGITLDGNTGIVSASQVFASGVNLANVASGNITPTSVVISGEGATAVTINSSGINITGVITATSFYGDGSTLTGISVNRFLSITTRVGIVSVTAFAGILTVFGRSSNTNVFV